MQTRLKISALKISSVALAALMLAISGAPAYAQAFQGNPGAPSPYAQTNMAPQGASTSPAGSNSAQAQTSYQPPNDTPYDPSASQQQTNAQMQNAGAAQVIQPMQQGGITYVSGGIGEGEEQALKSVAHDYDLQIVNTTRQGGYTANTSLVIEGKNGRELIRADNTGPLFYAQLPAGNYTVKASVGDQQEVRHVHISGHKPVDMHLVWQES